MNYSRRQLQALGETLGECVTRKEGGRVIYGSGGGGSAPAQQTAVSDLPEWAKPYAKETLGKTQALTDLSSNPYQTYGQYAAREGISGERIAGFTPLQERAFEGAAQLGPTAQTGVASNIAEAAAAGALRTGYQPGYFANQFQAPDFYRTGQFGVQGVSAPQLQQYQMGPAERAQTQSFTQPGSAEAYMDPFMQNVVNKQTREAERQAGLAARQRRAQAIQQGAFGGTRAAITEAAAERDKAQLLSDIYGTGQQAAFQQGRQQFNTEQQARLQAQLANQQAGLTVGGQNLAAQLGIQQLGAGQNLQAQLANQAAAQQAQAQREASRQFGYGQRMQAAGLGAQYGQAAQQLAEQSRQYGAGLGLQGLQTALTGAGQLGQLGATEFGQRQSALGMQQQFGAQQQALEQQRLSQQYQDFLNQQRYPYQQLEFMSNILRGTPMGTVQTMYAPGPSPVSQLAGLGLGAYGLSRMGAFKEGGKVKDDKKPAGLSELALMKMGA